MTLRLERPIDWDKMQDLIPAVIQEAASGAVLMVGYMNREALEATLECGRVTFWSRSKNRLWTKGETSGHHLEALRIAVDCDGDALLILAQSHGPVCHLGTAGCFGHDAPRSRAEPLAFLGSLQQIIAQRLEERPQGSYIARLLAEGTRRIAQKVGEEGVELALASVSQDAGEILGEAADLLFHTMLLLQTHGLTLAQVAAELESRHEGSRGGHA